MEIRSKGGRYTYPIVSYPDDSYPGSDVSYPLSISSYPTLWSIRTQQIGDTKCLKQKKTFTSFILVIAKQLRCTLVRARCTCDLICYIVELSVTIKVSVARVRYVLFVFLCLYLRILDNNS